MITAEQVREWLRESAAPLNPFGGTGNASKLPTGTDPQKLADRINDALAPAVVRAYEDAASVCNDRDSWRDWEEGTVSPTDCAYAAGFLAEQIRQRTAAHAQAALEAERERIWQQAIEAAGQLLDSRAEATNSNSFRLMARSVRALKRPAVAK